MSNQPSVQRVVVDFRANSLTLELDQPLPINESGAGILDIGALGRLIGIEIAGIYLQIADPVPGSELQGRSVELTVGLDATRRALSVPRVGPHWEISFPSGNQCWNRNNGTDGVTTMCAVIAT